MQGAPLIRNQVVQRRQPRKKGRLTPTGVMEALHHTQFAVNGIVGLIEYTVLIAGICGASSTADQPDFFSSNQLRTRLPWSSPTVWLMCSAKRRRRWPNATTRQLVRWRQRCNKV